MQMLRYITQKYSQFKNTILLLTALLHGGMAWAQESISLQNCIEQAEKQSPQAGLLPFIKEAADLQAQLLQKNWLPQTNLAAQATWQSSTTDLPIELPGITVPEMSKWQYKATLDLSQTIWDGGVTKEQQKIVLANSIAEQEKVKADIYTLREQVSALFFGVLLANKQLDNAALLRKDLESKRKKTLDLKSGGLATNYQVLALDAKLLELEQQVVEATNRKGAALKALSLLTNNPNVEKGNLVADNLTPKSDVYTINRPELRYFEAQKKAIAASEQLIKAKNMPKVGAFATAGLGRPGLNFLSNSLQPYLIGGVQVRVPLTHFYSHSQSIESQQLRINQDKIRQLEQNFVWLTQVKAVSQKVDIEKLDVLISNDRKLIEIREKMLATADVQLQNGIITTNDYLTEVNNVDMARQNLALHEVQRLQAVYLLGITLGN